MRWKKKSAEICSALFALSVKPIREAAARGNVAALFGLGRLYELARDEAEAALCFRRAADRGHAAARFRLGRMYHEGRGLPRNDDKAARWLRMSAEQGHRRARRYLKWMLRNPEGFPERGFWAAVLTEMDCWHEYLEEKGRLHWVWIVAVALFLATHFGPTVWDRTVGRLRERDPEATVHKAAAPAARGARVRTAQVGRRPRTPPKDLRRRAEQGEAVAQYRLGRWHQFFDNRQAVLWYKKAADQGFAEAQYSLGWMYEFGHGVPKDDAQALIWYRKAAEQGHAWAGLMVGRLEGRPPEPDGRPPARQGGK